MQSLHLKIESAANDFQLLVSGMDSVRNLLDTGLWSLVFQLLQSWDNNILFRVQKSHFAKLIVEWREKI